MTIFKAAQYLFGALGAFIAVYVVVTLAIGGMSMTLAPFQGEVEKNQQIEGSGDYHVQAHDYFYQQCSDIQSEQQNISIYEDSGTDKGKIAALRAELNDDVNEYNSKAANNYTAGQFKADELPYHIDANQEVESCGSATNSE